MAHAQKPDFVFRRNGRVHLDRRGRQFSRLLAAEVCASAVVMVVMLDKPCSEVVWRVLVTHPIRRFPIHFPFRASPCAITSQLESTYNACLVRGLSPPRHMPEGYLKISNKGLSMSEAAVLFLLRMLPSGMWGPVFWCINAVVQEQCPTPVFMESLYTEAGGCAFRIRICTVPIKLRELT